MMESKASTSKFNNCQTANELQGNQRHKVDKIKRLKRLIDFGEREKTIKDSSTTSFSVLDPISIAESGNQEIRIGKVPKLNHCPESGNQEKIRVANVPKLDSGECSTIVPEENKLNTTSTGNKDIEKLNQYEVTSSSLESQTGSEIIEIDMENISGSSSDALKTQKQIMLKTADDITEVSDCESEYCVQKISDWPSTKKTKKLTKVKKQLKQVELENVELKHLVKDQQAGLELIMTKFRQQNELLMQKRSFKKDFAKMYKEKYIEIILRQSFKLQEMINIVNKVIRRDFCNYKRFETELHRLKKENEVLRQITSIPKGVEPNSDLEAEENN